MFNSINIIKGDLKLLFKRSSSLTDRQKKHKRRTIAQILGLLLIFIQIVITVVFLGLLFYLNIVPDKYMMIGVVILSLITLYNLISQFCGAHIIGKILAIFLSIVLLIGSLYVARANSMLGSISGTSTKIDTIDVIVLKSDPSTSLNDVKNYTFGYNSVLDKTNSEKALTDIMTNQKTTLTTKTYTDWSSLFKGLYNGDVGVILLNDATRSTLIEQYTDFEDKTKIIDTVSITTKVTLSTADKKVNEESFTIYISGNDEYGNLTESGRSDVNIIATINPKTRQMLLVTTPRDYYITLTSNDGLKGLDKLTHAGNFGIDGSITALNNLYGIDIDYYVKVNFTGAVGIVDALGGITVNSEVDFTNCSDTAPIAYHFVTGNNECDGEKALAFCRERQVFTNGDNQRGRNQMIAIQGIINKATSPAILAKYGEVLDSVSGMFATSMPTDTITSLIKGQLNNPTTWTVQSYNVSGTGSSQTSHFYGLYGMSVILPDYSTVNTAISLMNKTSNGDVFNVDEYVESIAGESATQSPTAKYNSTNTPKYTTPVTAATQPVTETLVEPVTEVTTAAVAIPIPTPATTPIIAPTVSNAVVAPTTKAQ